MQRKRDTQTHLESSAHRRRTAEVPVKPLGASPSSPPKTHARTQYLDGRDPRLAGVVTGDDERRTQEGGGLGGGDVRVVAPPSVAAPILWLAAKRQHGVRVHRRLNGVRDLHPHCRGAPLRGRRRPPLVLRCQLLLVAVADAEQNFR